VSKKPNPARMKPLSALEVGRFLKQLSVSMRDGRTGNLMLSQALLDLSNALIGEKYTLPGVAGRRFIEQGGFEFDDGLDFTNLTTAAIQQALADPELPKAQLIILGTDRFGIARSRMEKLPREEIVKLITAAAQHEESLSLISEEARKGGQTRSS